MICTVPWQRHLGRRQQPSCLLVIRACATSTYSRTPDFGVRYLLGCDVRAHLPQLVLPKETALSSAEEHVGESAPPVMYVPGTSGWVTSVTMKGFLTRLRCAARLRRPEHHIAVALDSDNEYLSKDVLCHAARLQIHLLLIPARLTAADARRNACTWPWRICHHGHSGGHQWQDGERACAQALPVLVRSWGRCHQVACTSEIYVHARHMMAACLVCLPRSGLSPGTMASCICQ